METAPLKSFATWARTSLIREVTARIAAVLAPGSSERVEQATAVIALEKAVAVAGGGDKGRAAVADKVAYTWFNRIVALRFMDANGYTGIGVVSPQAGVEVGQPEILAEAKRGVIDPEIASPATRAAVAGFLDGTRTSVDPQGEAYALLLADYCRHWNKAMPFMFEREGDYTELLIPANLLADDSVLNRSIKVLTNGVCQDVEVIGWLYQFYISERKDEVFAGFKKNKKAGPDEIPAATQLFTPHWIVRYLVENSLGRLWMLNRPTSSLINQMDYYVAPVDQTDFLTITKPEELKIIDPACGSGHMLTYAFDLLYSIYEEEGYAPAEIPGLILTHNLYGTELDPRAGALAAFALTMKARAKQRTFLTKAVKPNICVVDPISFSPDELAFLVTPNGDRHAEEAFWNQFAEADTRGALIRPDQNVIARLSNWLDQLEDDGDLLRADALAWAAKVIEQARYLSPRYAVVVANPPYAGLGNLNGGFAEWAKKAYPVTKTDLYSMFIERALGLAVRRGLVAMVTMQSWMSLRCFEGLRAEILGKNHLVSMAHLGARAFDSIGGEVVGTTAFVIAKQAAPPGARGCFLRLVTGRSESAKAQRLREISAGSTEDRYVIDLVHLSRVPGKALVYWATDRDFELFETADPIGEHIETRVGLITGDNDSFLRRWHEVSISSIDFDARPGEPTTRRWFPYVKGGEYRRWAGNYEFVVNWYNDGAEVKANVDQATGRIRAHNYNGEFAFREGFTWSGISSNGFAVRDVPPGFMFDTKGPMGFAVKADELRLLQGVLNSAVAVRFMRMLAPTLDFNLGHVMSIPFLKDLPEDFASWAEECVQLAWKDWNQRETAWGFERSPLVIPGMPGSLADRLAGHAQACRSAVARMRELETTLNAGALQAYGLSDTQDRSAADDEITLDAARVDEADFSRTAVEDLISYSVGCMFGRYSLDEPGLILAEQGGTVEEYLAKVPAPSFMPDADNVIPIVDGDWFEDDIVERFRQFLRVAFGEQHFEENLRFVTAALGVKNLRDYFVKSFYKDHVQRYKKRPIYWLFSSPRGSFNALIYTHRYTPSTASTVLNEYLREFQAKLKASLAHAERSNNAKEADRLRKVLLELDEYEHDVL